MRIERVRAQAFGPLINQTLELGTGMTLVWGLNESGKSTWHAALYAGLCGIRRTRGRGRDVDVDFAERHRPWDNEDWKVSLLLVLNDGRRIEICQDLDGKVDCRATDTVLGRDVSSEIISEGTPDGSRWLGLDRRSFLAIACVRQAELLSVQHDPGLLQEYLQRAAATAGTDATAAAALERIDEFQREQVGQDRANSTKPLRRAIEQLERARNRLERVNVEHAAFLELVAQAKALTDESETAARRLRLAEAAAAHRHASRLKNRLDRAREIASRYPGGAPPRLVRDDELARDVSTALAGWQNKPEVPVLLGASAEEIRARIAALPPMPEGDLTPHPSLSLAHDRYLTARQALEMHRRQRPTEVSRPIDARVTVGEVQILAIELDTPIPEVDSQLERRARDARERLDRATPRQRRPITALMGGIAIAVGAAALLLSYNLVGIALLIGGVFALVRAAFAAHPGVRDADEWQRIETELAQKNAARSVASARRATALQKVHDNDLPEDPGSLRRLAQQLADHEQSKNELERWTLREGELETELNTATAELAEALHARGFPEGVEEAWEHYEADCREHAQQAERAKLRDPLEAQLVDRGAAEAAVNQANEKRTEAHRLILDIAAKCGDGADTDEGAIATLRRWQDERSVRLQRHEEMLSEWTELETILEGGTLDTLAAEVDRRLEEAERLALGLNAEELVEARRVNTGEREIAELRRTCATLRDSLTEARTRGEEAAARLDSVAEAEEASTAAEAELTRVRSLDDVLLRTRTFLEEAESRVHRDIARVLADTIRPWLSPVTAGRYSDVRVDPESLEVQVLDNAGAWRAAGLVSYGTAEQIYLLLRSSLARHLGNHEEICPLILDDVTTHCDGQRTTAMLNLLREMSRERQVILFSQEDDVLAWARANLKAPEDRLVSLNS